MVRRDENKGGWVPPELEQSLGSDLSQVTVEQLQGLVGRVEQQFLEFKQKPWSFGKQSNECAKDLAAAANGGGTLFVLGVSEDSDKTASDLVPYPGHDPEPTDWIRQIAANRITPPIHLDMHVISDRDGSMLLCSVRPSLDRPHAVVAKTGDKSEYSFPLRVGATTIYLHETQIADRYRARFDRHEAHQATLLRRHESAHDLITSDQDPSDWAWLVLAALPEQQGHLSLTREVYDDYEHWIRSASAGFPGEGTGLTALTTGFRRLIATDVGPGVSHGRSCHLHLDGSSAAAVGLWKGRNRANPTPTSDFELTAYEIFRGVGAK